MSDANADYAAELEEKSAGGLRRWIDFQRPYRWNIRRLEPGRTLDVGCGVGRHLIHLPPGSVGVDFNEHVVARARARGGDAKTVDAFTADPGEPFDSILLSHVLEHMTVEQGRDVLGQYLPYLRPGGRVIAICPQEKGYYDPPGEHPDELDPSGGGAHVTFLDPQALESILEEVGLRPEKAYSFPFFRPVGRLFRYNESVVIGRKPASAT
jgi:SAM-dependent methyltransferase